MKNRNKFLLILSTLLILTSCKNRNEEIHISESHVSNESVLKDVSYFTYFNQQQKDKIINNFVFANNDGEILKIEKISMDNYRDIFYYELDKPQRILYMFGNGGLFKINFNTLDVTVLSNEDINVVETGTDSLYYYINGGFDEDGYYSQICKWEDSCVELNYPVNDLFYKEGNLYVSEGFEGDYFLTTINEDGVYQSKIKSAIYNFVDFNDELYGATTEGLINIKGIDTIIPYKNQTGEILIFPPEPFYDSDKQLYLHDQMNHSLYKVIIDDEKKIALCEKIAQFNKGDILFPTLVDDLISIKNKEKVVKTFNLKQQEVVNEVNLDLDLFHHVIRLK